MPSNSNPNWEAALKAMPIKSCGRLDLHTFLVDTATVGRVSSDRVRYVYFEDGSECVVLGGNCDLVAYASANYKPTELTNE